jgi:NAD(P)H-dependent FMN reductase
MKLTIISGSHRLHSQSGKVARHIAESAKKSFAKVELIDLAGNPLPLWDDAIWAGDPEWTERLAPLQKSLQESDAFVVISPEWHGQVPAGLKNFFLMCSAKEVGHKPALIVTVSSVDGGAYPVAELRMSSYKNNRICYIPEQIIVRNVETVLNDDPAENNPDADTYFRDRIAWTLSMLEQYAIALKQVRASGVTYSEPFANGM